MTSAEQVDWFAENNRLAIDLVESINFDKPLIDELFLRLKTEEARERRNMFWYVARFAFEKAEIPNIADEHILYTFEARHDKETNSADTVMGLIELIKRPEFDVRKYFEQLVAPNVPVFLFRIAARNFPLTRQEYQDFQNSWKRCNNKVADFRSPGLAHVNTEIVGYLARQEALLFKDKTVGTTRNRGTV